MPSEIYNILLCLISISFFSGIEIAFISANRLQIELLAKEGTTRGAILSKFFKNSSHFLGTTLVCNTISIVLYGVFMTELLEPYLQQWFKGLDNDIIISIVDSVIATIIVMMTGEFIPKIIFLSNPNGMLAFFALPMNLLYTITGPVVKIISHGARFFITRVFRLDFSEDIPAFTLTDLDEYVKNSQERKTGEEPEIDAKIFNNALEFKKARVKDCMIPRTEVVAINIEDGIDTLKTAFIESGHSKIFIYRNSIDEIIGYCHSLSLFNRPNSIEEVLKPISIFTEHTPANEVLISFIAEHKSLALVVDEFGGTSGIVSMEDIIEEILGEINDEHDEPELLNEAIDKHNYLLSGRLEIDFLNDKYHWNLPTGDYDTLGGFIIDTLQDLPEPNQIIEIDPFLITIVTMDETRIDTVKLTLKEGDVV